MTVTQGTFSLNAMYLNSTTNQILFEVETSSVTHVKRMYYLAKPEELAGKTESIIQLLFEHPHWAISLANPNLKGFTKLEPTPQTYIESDIVCSKCDNLLENKHCGNCGYID